MSEQTRDEAITVLVRDYDVQHKPDCDTRTKRTVSVPCPRCNGTGRATDPQHQMKDRNGKPWPTRNCAPCAGSARCEVAQYPECTCGLADTLSALGGREQILTADDSDNPTRALNTHGKTGSEATSADTSGPANAEAVAKNVRAIRQESERSAVKTTQPTALGGRPEPIDQPLPPEATQVLYANLDELYDGKPVGGRPETGWQPIATAPKDGNVLMWAPAERLYEAQNLGKPWAKPEYRIGMARDWTWSTHWQPLPSPPLQEQP
jgi:hypothetical protein